MTDILSSYRQLSLVYINNIVVYSRSFEEHLDHITQLLLILLIHIFQLNPSKCMNFPLFLNFSNNNYSVILTTDASKVSISGTLQQITDGKTKNLYYHSQVISSTQRRYDSIELETLAIWLCFQRIRSYLLGRSIIIYTYHCPLCNMMNSSVKNRRVDRISILLQEYHIEKN
ncbi:unnamed protein product [Rotaria sp. Silwood1]|nr:unnamed protein product [Rotaria sp. Silwood1]CAF1670477.1 unnamed protein product [Rotaria sp. Silwood1]CAF3811526.1 unnamed protein product [Rotaria sp. Silwood1]CAF4797758.1 unnamed protein product [Rotaria sp. Silwood1]